MVKIGNTFIYLIAFARFFISTTFTLGYIYTAEFYPTRIRAIRLGMATGFARLAGIATPIISTHLSERNVSSPYTVLTIVAFTAICVAFLLPVETLFRSLDTRTDRKK